MGRGKVTTGVGEKEDQTWNVRTYSRSRKTKHFPAEEQVLAEGMHNEPSEGIARPDL